MIAPDHDPYYDDPVSVVILDTETGEQATDDRWSHYWWEMGNGSCDCNRELLFRDHDSGRCLGASRYLIIQMNGKPAPPELNDGYPADLVKRFVPRPDTGGKPCPSPS